MQRSLFFLIPQALCLWVLAPGSCSPEWRERRRAIPAHCNSRQRLSFHRVWSPRSNQVSSSFSPGQTQKTKLDISQRKLTTLLKESHIKNKIVQDCRDGWGHRESFFIWTVANSASGDSAASSVDTRSFLRDPALHGPWSRAIHSTRVSEFTMWAQAASWPWHEMLVSIAWNAIVVTDQGTFIFYFTFFSTALNSFHEHVLLLKCKRKKIEEGISDQWKVICQKEKKKHIKFIIRRQLSNRAWR